MDRIFAELQMLKGDVAEEDYGAVTLEFSRFLRAGGHIDWADWCSRSESERGCMVRAGEILAAENLASLQAALGYKTSKTQAEYCKELLERTREMLGK